MASLSANPLGADFEDLVVAHLAARVGAYHRLLRAGKKEYHELGFKDATTRRIAQDHNGAASLLDGGDTALLA